MLYKKAAIITMKQTDRLEVLPGCKTLGNDLFIGKTTP